MRVRSAGDLYVISLRTLFRIPLVPSALFLDSRSIAAVTLSSSSLSATGNRAEY
jgi:hypothetical protein